jgi:hypothetical protein
MAAVRRCRKVGLECFDLFYINCCYACRSLEPKFRRAFEERSKSQGESGKDWNWHVNELRAFFMSAVESVARTQSVTVFVDALDEADDGAGDQDASYQIVSDFHKLNDLLHLSQLRSAICFSCRHFPIVADNQGREIHVEKENHADISIYVRDELHRRLSTSEAEKQQLVELHKTIVREAQGVFQWATLVVDMTIRHHNHGKSPREIWKMLAEVPKELGDVYKHIWKMLAEVPKELGDVYKHILSEIINKGDHQQTLRLMRWLCLAERPLTVKELCFAMRLPDTEICPPESPLAGLELPTHDAMVRQIISLSGGLIESKQHRRGQILQFIHQTVNDFLLRDGLGFLDMETRCNPIGQGHRKLSIICANYIRLAEVNDWNKPDAEAIKAQLPFVDYAARYWFLHAEKAETLGIPHDYLLRLSDHCPKIFELWAKVYRILKRYYYFGPRLDGASTMLHIASRSNFFKYCEGFAIKIPLSRRDGWLFKPSTPPCISLRLWKSCQRTA